MEEVRGSTGASGGQKVRVRNVSISLTHTHTHSSGCLCVYMRLLLFFLFLTKPTVINKGGSDEERDRWGLGEVRELRGVRG